MEFLRLQCYHSDVNQLALKHHRTLVDARGNVLAAIGPDLWAEIQCARRRFLIDTNFPWRQYLANKYYLDCAFILGATIQNEMNPSAGVLFDGAKKPIVAHNFFLFTQSPNSDYWAIDRMDEGHRYIYDQLSLDEEPQNDPPISVKTLTDVEVRQIQDEARYLLTQVRRELMAILQCPKGLTRQRLLVQEVRNKKKGCFKDFFEALDVTRRCYAVLLINDQSARRDYRDKPVNGLEDSVLIGEALFLNAEILSCNGHVKTMGRSYCQISVYEKLP
jgi:hypothetical protein